MDINYIYAIWNHDIGNYLGPYSSLLVTCLASVSLGSANPKPAAPTPKLQTLNPGPQPGGSLNPKP